MSGRVGLAVRDMGGGMEIEMGGACGWEVGLVYPVWPRNLSTYSKNIVRRLHQIWFGVWPHLLPVHSVRNELLRVGHVSAHRALAALALHDPRARAVITRAPGAAGHHHRVGQQLLADWAQQLVRDSHLRHVSCRHHTLHRQEEGCGLTLAEVTGLSSSKSQGFFSIFFSL